MPSSLGDFYDALSRGEYDDRLAQIVEAVNDRRRAMDARKRLSFAPGDVVRFNASANPKYLIGHTATITAINRTRVTLDMPDDPALGRYRGQSGVKCPVSIIEPIEEEN